ncbi:MAG: 2-oxoacid:acceptor oxidoreductase family protein [Chloroflexota bacterium]|nr:2-oxoacid:acceptor oxidoreductase family protein [Chloroflexota bacterium]
MTDKKGYYEVQMVGWGGQGLVSAAHMLAQAAGIYDSKHVTQTELHGISQRGGLSETEVIISNEEIDYPYISRPDVLLALTQKECKNFAPKLKDDGMLIIDSMKVTEVPPTKAKVYRLPLTQIAREAGSELATNMVSLAAICALSGAVSFEALQKTIEEHMPPKMRTVNIAALKAGWAAAEKLKSNN